MFSFGMKASEVIKKLQALVEEHGDKECFVSSGDYPGGVDGVKYVATIDDPYINNDSIVISGGI